MKNRVFCFLILLERCYNWNMEKKKSLGLFVCVVVSGPAILVGTLSVKYTDVWGRLSLWGHFASLCFKKVICGSR